VGTFLSLRLALVTVGACATLALTSCGDDDSKVELNNFPTEPAANEGAPENFPGGTLTFSGGQMTYPDGWVAVNDSRLDELSEGFNEFAPSGLRLDIEGVVTTNRTGLPSVFVARAENEQSLSAAAYAKAVIPISEQMVPGFELSSPVTPTSIAGSRAATYQYTGQPGTPVHVKIVMAELSGALHSISYTARDDEYQAHLAQFDSMLSSLGSK
jgi:hypothetical protein